MSELPLTFRANPYFVLAWFLATTFIGVMFFVVHRVVLNSPIWVQLIFAIMVLVCYAMGVMMLLARCTVSSDGICVARFVKRCFSWSEVAAWTRWGDNGPVFVRFSNGRIYGTDGPTFSPSAAERFAEILEQHAGFSACMMFAAAR